MAENFYQDGDRILGALAALYLKGRGLRQLFLDLITEDLKKHPAAPFLLMICIEDVLCGHDEVKVL